MLREESMSARAVAVPRSAKGAPGNLRGSFLPGCNMCDMLLTDLTRRGRISHVERPSVERPRVIGWEHVGEVFRSA